MTGPTQIPPGLLDVGLLLEVRIALQHRSNRFRRSLQLSLQIGRCRLVIHGKGRFGRFEGREDASLR